MLSSAPCRMSCCKYGVISCMCWVHLTAAPSAHDAFAADLAIGEATSTTSSTKSAQRTWLLRQLTCGGCSHSHRGGAPAGSCGVKIVVIHGVTRVGDNSEPQHWNAIVRAHLGWTECLDLQAGAAAQLAGDTDEGLPYPRPRKSSKARLSVVWAHTQTRCNVQRVGRAVSPRHACVSAGGTAPQRTRRRATGGSARRQVVQPLPSACLPCDAGVFSRQRLHHQVQDRVHVVASP